MAEQFNYDEGSFGHFFLQQLQSMGLWEKEAEQVLEQYQNSDASKELKERWNEQTSAYPDVMKNVLLACLKSEALTWIDENKPQHWARPMFLTKSEQEALFAKEGIKLSDE